MKSRGYGNSKQLHKNTKYYNKQAYKFAQKRSKQEQKAIEEANEFNFLPILNLDSKYAIPLLALLILGQINVVASDSTDLYKTSLAKEPHDELSMTGSALDVGIDDGRCVIFKLYGPDMGFAEIYKPQSGTFFTSTEILNQYCSVIEIGNPYSGMRLKEVSKRFEEYGESVEKFNVVLLMHGVVNNNDDYEFNTNEHQLSSSFSPEILPKEIPYNGTVNMDASDLLVQLGEFTGGKPLDLVVVSCFGANIHRYASSLPEGSTITSFSDHNRVFIDLDARSEIFPSVYDILFADGFYMQGLVTAYTFSQKYAFNTPIISQVGKNKVEIVKIGDSLGRISYSDINADLYRLLALKDINEMDFEIVFSGSNYKALEDYKFDYAMLNFENIEDAINKQQMKQYKKLLFQDYYLTQLNGFSIPSLFDLANARCSNKYFRQDNIKHCEESEKMSLDFYEAFFTMSDLDQLGYINHLLIGDFVPIHSLLMLAESITILGLDGEE